MHTAVAESTGAPPSCWSNLLFVEAANKREAGLQMGGREVNSFLQGSG